MSTTSRPSSTTGRPSSGGGDLMYLLPNKPTPPGKNATRRERRDYRKALNAWKKANKRALKEIRKIEKSRERTTRATTRLETGNTVGQQLAGVISAGADAASAALAGAADLRAAGATGVQAEDIAAGMRPGEDAFGLEGPEAPESEAGSSGVVDSFQRLSTPAKIGVGVGIAVGVAGAAKLLKG